MSGRWGALRADAVVICTSQFAIRGLMGLCSGGENLTPGLYPTQTWERGESGLPFLRREGGWGVRLAL